MALPILVKFVMDNLREQEGNKAVTRQFLEMESLDMVVWDEDFLGDTLIGSYQSATSGAGAAALAISDPTASVPWGTATLVSGTDIGGRSQATLGLHWRGGYNAVTAAIVSINTVTSAKVEVGWADSTASRAGQVNAIDTPTFNATDAAVWVFDTDSTVRNDGWYGISVINAVAGPVYAPTTVGNAAGDTLPVADTRELFIVALQGSSVRYLVGRNLLNRWMITGDSGWLVSGITSTISLTPWLFVQSRAGAASRTLTIDKWTTWGWRST